MLTTFYYWNRLRWIFFLQTKLSDPISPKSSPSDRFLIYNTAWADIDSLRGTKIQQRTSETAFTFWHLQNGMWYVKSAQWKTPVERMRTSSMRCSLSLPWHCRGGRWWCVPSRSPAPHPTTHQEPLTACQSGPTIRFVVQNFSHIWAVLWIRYDLVRILLSRSFRIRTDKVGHELTNFKCTSNDCSKIFKELYTVCYQRQMCQLSWIFFY